MDQPLMVFIHLAKDDKKEIASQIEAGKRPLNWDKVGHPDYEAWVQTLALHPEAGVAVMI